MSRVKIGDFLKRSKIPIDIEDHVEYKRVTIRINHNGVSLRDQEKGRLIGTKKQFVLKAGQFIVSKIDARYGAFGIAPIEVDGAIITGNFWAYNVDHAKVNIEWLNQFTNSPDFYDICERASSGITHRKYLDESFFLNYEIDLPDVKDQLRIIEEVKVKKGSFAKLTTELTHQQTLVKQLRQQLLQEAVQGKLSTDQPIPAESDLAKQYGKLWHASGAELLAHIRTEKAKLIKEKKIKADKPLPPITEEEMPFELPEGWVWARLGEVAYDTEGGKSPNCLHVPAQGNQWGVIKTTAIQEMYFLENENKVLPANFKVSDQHKVHKGDLLITRAGPKNRVGIVCCVEHLTRNLILSDKTIRITHSKYLLNSQFISLALNSKSIKGIIETKMTGMADSQVNISQDNIKGFPIPLPPLQTQHRIVAQLAAYQGLCASLEAQIQESLTLNGALLQEVLREALSEK